jgi:hypothetical protein
MIKFALVCDKGHEFESWFRSGEDYETQAKRGFVGCPDCGSVKIGKAVMAPAVARSDRDRPRAAPAPEAPPVPAAPQPMTLLDEKQRQLRDMIRDLHARIAATTTDVGARFPEEARRMHEGEIPEAPIRGAATLEEAKALWDDGIPVLPVPGLPEERN